MSSRFPQRIHPGLRIAFAAHAETLRHGAAQAHAAFATITSLSQLARPIRADDAATAIAQRG